MTMKDVVILEKINLIDIKKTKPIQFNYLYRFCFFIKFLTKIKKDIE